MRKYTKIELVNLGENKFRELNLFYNSNDNFIDWLSFYEDDTIFIETEMISSENKQCLINCLCSVDENEKNFLEKELTITDNFYDWNSTISIVLKSVTNNIDDINNELEYSDELENNDKLDLIKNFFNVYIEDIKKIFINTYLEKKSKDVIKKHYDSFISETIRKKYDTYFLEDDFKEMIEEFSKEMMKII